MAHGIIGPGIDVAHHAGARIETRDQVAGGVDNISVAQIRRDPAAFAAAHVVPVFLGDAAAPRASRCGRWNYPAARRRRDTENRCPARRGKTARSAGS